MLAACRPVPPLESEPPVRLAEPPTHADDLPLTLAVQYVPNRLAARGNVTLGDRGGELSLVYGPVGEPLELRTPSLSVSPEQTVEIAVLGLSVGEWSVAAELDGEVGEPWTVTTTLPEGVDGGRITVPWSEPDDGVVVCGTLRRPNGYLCVDRAGTPVAYVPLPMPPMFARSLDSGSWLIHPRAPGQLIQIDRLGQVEGTWELEDLDGLRFVHDELDNHDVVEIREGPWTGALALLSRTRDERLDGAGIIVFDPDSRSVLWDWTAHGVLGDGVPIDPDKLSYERGSTETDFPRDWHHANALTHGRTGDVDHFWMSLRHQDWVVRIDTDTDRVGLRLGFEGDVQLLDGPEGAPADASDWMFHQHAPEWAPREDGSVEMLVVDNGNNRPVDSPYSRLARFVLAADRQSAWLEWSYGAPAPAPEHFFLPTAGDIDASGSDGVRYTHHDDRAGWVDEVGWDGALRWQWKLPGHGELYRTEGYDTIYGPAFD